MKDAIIVILCLCLVAFGVVVWLNQPLVAIDSNNECVWVEIKGERMDCSNMPSRYNHIRVK